MTISPIQGTIRDAIEDSITWPVRKVIPILPGDYRYLSRLFLFKRFLPLLKAFVNAKEGN